MNCPRCLDYGYIPVSIPGPPVYGVSPVGPAPCPEPGCEAVARHAERSRRLATAHQAVKDVLKKQGLSPYELS